MNFSRKVKEKAAEVYRGLKVSAIIVNEEIYHVPENTTKVKYGFYRMDPEEILVMIRRYEQRIEWAFKASIRRECEILTLRKKIAKLEMRLSKRKPIQTDLFIETDINPDTSIGEGAGTPFHGGIDEPREEIHSGDQATSIRSLLQETPEKQSGMDPQDADRERN